ncbi:Zinc finger ZZ-type [Penicillium atrosanguineum]|nr:Zinc finger ZZ-type [Penicillium atrosanguineum]
MATPALPTHPGPEHLVTVKVLYNDSNRRFKLPLRDLKAQVFPQKLRLLLNVPADVNVILERYSDSAGSYIHLDCDNAAVYKQLFRAAKAKSKLRIKASTVDPSAPTTDTAIPVESTNQMFPSRTSYLDTVLSSPVAVASPEFFPISSEAAPVLAGETTAPQITLPIGQPRYRDFEMEQDKLRFPIISHNSPGGMFCIDCNNCGHSIVNEHYHCSICEHGDYDLCPQCVEDGASCRGEGHWLIKRVVVNGVERIIKPAPVQVQRAPEPTPELIPGLVETVPEMPATVPPTDVKSSDTATQGDEKPMCNGCCREADESNLVRCNDCEDYDLCLRCLLRNKHGHHPAHTFSLGSDRNFCLKNLIMSRCLPGRQFKHAAICDGCDNRIVGTRHKCLSCPDWDYCRDCIATAPNSHPGHRFVPIYEAISDHPYGHSIHYGIFCDGPLCKNKPAQSYISGVRYKCAVCDDVDFCASCEALPTHDHNQTHPLVKFKTPVRTVTVSTVSDDGASGAVALGDDVSARSRSEANTTVDELPEEKPVVVQEPVEVEASKPEEAKVEAAPAALEPATYEPSPAKSVIGGFQAYFVRDAIPDGTKMPPNTLFRQTWTLYNPGPNAWPEGSDVRFVGGDTMFNVDSHHPSSVESIRAAMESNKLHAPIEAGQSADFTVTLRTSSREGTAISYWRLKLPNGEAIGHRLWCDIQVQAAISSSSSDVETEPTPEEDSKTSQSTVAEPIGSHMIFPKLEKESPESSTHEAIMPSHRAPTVSTACEEDDMESLALEEVSTDAGFLTDEEYDVLDASDQEYLDAKQSTH